jgi:rhodanese-related sulfurtransferase
MPKRVKHIDPENCQNLIEAQEVVCLDVRSFEDYAEGHLPGALNLDIVKSNLSDYLSKLDRDLPYLIYCKNGIRSHAAVRIMVMYNFTTLYHLTNGISDYEGELSQLNNV